MSASTGLAGWEESLTKKQWCLLVFLSPERAAAFPAPPAVTLKLVNLVLARILLALFELLLLRWSLQ